MAKNTPTKEVHDVLTGEVIVVPMTEEDILLLEETKANHQKDLWRDLRQKRDNLLSVCDWTQMPDVDIDKDLWTEYRQTLRDLPGNTEDPANPLWPEPPQ